MNGACGCAQNVFKIWQGDEKTMNLGAISRGCTTGPLDLTSCTGITVALPAADGTFVDIAGVIDSPNLLGKFHVPIAAEDSALLAPGELQSFTAQFTFSGEIVTGEYSNCLSVFATA